MVLGGRRGRRIHGAADRAQLVCPFGPKINLSRKLALVAPRRGALLIMRGDRALHRVRTVGGSEDRINLILAYDVPGSACTRDTLNTYLYSDIPAMAGDPNYSA